MPGSVTPATLTTLGMAQVAMLQLVSGGCRVTQELSQIYQQVYWESLEFDFKSLPIFGYAATAEPKDASKKVGFLSLPDCAKLPFGVHCPV